MKCIKKGLKVELEKNCYYNLCGGWKIQCPSTNINAAKLCRRQKEAWVPEITVCGLSKSNITPDIINLIFLITHDNKLIITNSGEPIIVDE